MLCTTHFKKNISTPSKQNINLAFLVISFSDLLGLYKEELTLNRFINTLLQLRLKFPFRELASTVNTNGSSHAHANYSVLPPKLDNVVAWVPVKLSLF